jgi:phosphatidylglycerol:prolipoprotein diacylglycerol transferase
LFPYVDQPTFTVFGRTFYAFGVMALAALAIGIAMVVRRALRVGFSLTEIVPVLAWTVTGGFVGSHLVSEIAYYPERVLADPLELLRVWGTMSSAGGMGGGLLGAWLALRCMAIDHERQLRFLDIVAFAFPFAWIFGRAGCALAHDHLGIETKHWLAVRFPEGPRFDLGLLEFLYTIPLAGLFLVLDRWRWPTGFYLGLFFVLYSPVRFLMDVLRVSDALYFGWTPAQYVCVAGAVGGLATLAAAFRPWVRTPAALRKSFRK